MKLALISTLFVCGLWFTDACANAVLPSGCTGAVFIMPGMAENRKALVVTNGHCLGIGDYDWEGIKFLNPREVIIERYFQAGDRYIVTVFKTPREGGTGYRAEKIIFGTMTGTDLAVLEISATYEDLRRLHYRIYSIANSLPPNGAKLHFQSYWANYDGLCTVAQVVPTLVEGPFVWNNGLKMVLDRRCRVFPGVSGTPGIPAGSDIIYAIANTEFTGRGNDCGIMDPCERDSGTGMLQPGVVEQSYAVPTAPLYSCYDPASAKFDLKLPNCTLTKK